MRAILALQAALVLAAAGAARGTPTWSYYADGDAGYDGLTDHRAREQAATVGRIGDNVNGGDWERAILDHAADPPAADGQYVWANGRRNKFTVEFDGFSSVRFTLEGRELLWEGLSGDFTDIFIRTRSSAGCTVLLSGLQFSSNDAAFAMGPLTSSGDGDVDYIRIVNDGAPFQSFVISGDATFTWPSGSPPSGSNLMFETRMTNVPEPGVISLLACGAAARRRRRRPRIKPEPPVAKRALSAPTARGSSLNRLTPSPPAAAGPRRPRHCPPGRRHADRPSRSGRRPVGRMNTLRPAPRNS